MARYVVRHIFKFIVKGDGVHEEERVTEVEATDAHHAMKIVMDIRGVAIITGVACLESEMFVEKPVKKRKKSVA